MNHALNEQLSLAGIFSPGSVESQRLEKHLARFFEKEYRSSLRNRISEPSALVPDSSPIAEATESLMSEHYDSQAEFFLSFLDKQYHAYSMAYYGDSPDAIRASSVTLEAAQHAKFSLIAKRAQITGRERIINIGCGFGSLETYLLTTYPDIEIVGLTPSKTQIQYLKHRIQSPGDPLSCGRFTLIEGDIENTPISILGQGRFNLVISIGVIEHFLSLRKAFDYFAALLAPQGRMFHHFISSQKLIRQFFYPGETRIGEYFPGGRVWPHDELPRHTKHFDLVNSWFVNGLNYWRTLEEWHQRYWNSIPQLYGAVFDIAAIKYWNEYFSLCKAMFAPMDGEFYGNSHYLFKLKG